MAKINEKKTRDLRTVDNTVRDLSYKQIFQFPFVLIDSLDFTNVSTIPEDAELADTYYTTCDDFEEDESSEEDRDPNSDSEEYDVLADYMQNALDLSGENAESTFGDTMSSLASSTTMRQQKIDSLRRYVCLSSFGTGA